MIFFHLLFFKAFINHMMFQFQFFQKLYSGKILCLFLKKDKRNPKKNYWHVSILLNASKIYYVYSFKCMVTSKMSLLNISANSGEVWARNTVLYPEWEMENFCRHQLKIYRSSKQPVKTFDNLPHDYIIAELHAYCFNSSSTRLKHN